MHSHRYIACEDCVYIRMYVCTHLINVGRAVLFGGSYSILYTAHNDVSMYARTRGNVV